MEIVDLYLRKSNKDARRSVERQLADLTEDATGVDLAVGRVFVDPDLSASRFARKGRPDFAQLLEHIRAGQCQVVGLAEASRGSRTLTEWSAFLDLCRSVDAKIWVQTHGRVYDLRRRRDWRALADEGLDAADESEKISERVLSGKRQAAVKGRPSGRPLYGYLRHYDSSGKLTHVTPHPDQAPVVVELVERVAAGEPLRSIARDMNARGLFTPTGRPWLGYHVRQTVMKPAYVAQRVHQGEVIGPADWPPLVDEQLWRRACAVLNQPGRLTHTRGTELAHWLANAITCGRCGTPLSYNTGGRWTRPNYLCHGCGRNAAAAPTLELVVEQALLARLARKDGRAAFRPARDVSTALRRLEAAKDQLRADADDNDRAYRMGEISARLAGLRESELTAQLRRVDAELARLTMPVELADLADVDIAAVWQDLGPDRRRAVARRLADLVLDPAPGRGPTFDPHRLDRSRWANDAQTWGELARHPLT